jgi:hypothetical protein
MSTRPVCPIPLQKIQPTTTSTDSITPVLQTLTCASGSHWCHLSDSQASPLGCPWKCNITQSTPQPGNKCLLWHHITQAPEHHLPTQLLDQGRGIPSDIARKFNSVNAFQNDVVSLHGVRPSKWRRSCRQVCLLTSLIVKYETTVTHMRYKVFVSVNIKFNVFWVVEWYTHTNFWSNLSTKHPRRLKL